MEGFKRSFEDYGDKYKYVIGDGDFSVYARLVKKSVIRQKIGEI